jgi:hypothetical protein
MPERLTRIVLALLAVTSAMVGVWAAFTPRSFYADFPGGGRAWVSPDGPYNEHLVRDVGELNLALTVVTLFALVVLSRQLVLATALAWLAYSVPHLVYHLRHLGPFSGGDVASIPTSLALAVVGALLLLIPPARSRSTDDVPLDVRPTAALADVPRA